jgi:predicted TIM-barrel fold metal-dependent hydrolase
MTGVHELARETLIRLDPTERDVVFGGNAVAVYRLDAAA